METINRSVFVACKKQVAQLREENRAAMKREAEAKKLAMNEAKRARRGHNMDLAIQAKGRKCKACNAEINRANGDIYAFHHIDPSGVKDKRLRKLDKISNLASRSSDDTELWREVAVTILVCGSCHSKIHPPLQPGEIESNVPRLIDGLTDAIYAEALHSLSKVRKVRKVR